jgi:hypothetical protein
MEAAGSDVQLIECCINLNGVGVLAKGWTCPQKRACHLEDATCSSLKQPRSAGAVIGRGGVTGAGQRRLRSALGVGIRKACNIRGGERTCGLYTRLGVEGCEFRRNHRCVEVVTVDSISSTFSMPF